MQMVGVDLLGLFPLSTSGNQYLLVAMDYFTKWGEAYPIPNIEATTVANTLINEIFFQFSPPEQIHSDQGRQFESKLFKEVCRILQIKKSRTTPYHPQCDGLVERYNRTLLNMLATASKGNPKNWESFVRSMCFAYNTSVQAIHRIT
jgi:transposase InsO family protein